MSVNYLHEKIEAAIIHANDADIMPHSAIEHFHTISEKELYHMIHHPKDKNEIILAKKRLIIEVLYQFADALESENADFNPVSPYAIRTLKKTNTFLHSLPYTLTKDQQETLNQIIEQAKGGKHINALIQGDVGCGKTIVTFVCMFAMADNGYQSVLTAPTGVLAEQHYNELKSYAEPLGYHVAYLANQKVSEKKKIIAGIKAGEYEFIVGTHAVFSDNVEYHNLGLAICDEEHRFGVLQREHLIKSNSGIFGIYKS